MPGKIVKKNGWATYWGGKLVGKPKKGRTKKQAQAQLNLLRGIEHGWQPTGKTGLAYYQTEGKKSKKKKKKKKRRK